MEGHVLFWGAFWVASMRFARVPLPEAEQMVISQKGFEPNRQPHYGQAAAVENTRSICVRRDLRRSIMTIHLKYLPCNLGRRQIHMTEVTSHTIWLKTWCYH